MDGLWLGFSLQGVGGAAIWVLLGRWGHIQAGDGSLGAWAMCVCVVVLMELG